jgi:hypothetical protein
VLLGTLLAASLWASGTSVPSAPAACRPLSAYVIETPPEMLRGPKGGIILHNQPAPGHYPGVLTTVKGHTVLVVWQYRRGLWGTHEFIVKTPPAPAFLAAVAKGGPLTVKVCVTTGANTAAVQAYATLRGPMATALRERAYGITWVNPRTPRPGATVEVAVANDSLVSDLFHLAADHPTSRWTAYQVAGGAGAWPYRLRFDRHVDRPNAILYWITLPPAIPPGIYGIWIELPSDLGGATIYSGFDLHVVV